MMELVRVRPKTNEIYRPFRNRAGNFVMADPKHGREKHHQRHAIYVESLSDVVRLLSDQGFHLWMKGELTGQQNLIAPKNIRVS